MSGNKIISATGFVSLKEVTQKFRKAIYEVIYVVVFMFLR